MNIVTEEQAMSVIQEIRKSVPYATNEKIIEALGVVKMLVTGCGTFPHRLFINLVVFVLLVQVKV